MRTRRPYFIFLCCTLAVLALAQDKLVFRDGKKTNCRIVAINPHSVTYRDSANGSNLVTVAKAELLIAEYKSGSVYIFGTEESEKAPAFTPPVDKKQAWRDKEATFSNNIIGIQLPDLLFSRLTLTYERLFMDKMLGVVIPASLTYDTRAITRPVTTDTTQSGSKIGRNVSFITGLDINMYFETKSHMKFFVGPRFRYGTDVRMGNITASSLQFQTGFFSPGTGKTTSTVAVGFGFAQIIVSKFNGINPKQSYPWFSFTYRLGFRL
jgi:hypothetical protein